MPSSINYTDLFEDIGEFLEGILRIRGMATGVAFPTSPTAANPDLPAILAEIESQLSTNGRNDVLSGVRGLIDSFKDSSIDWCNQLAAKITERLTHRTTILENLHLGDTGDVQAVLAELIRDMKAQTTPVTILKSAVTLGSLTSTLPSSANGTVIYSKVLDGVSAPGAGFAPNSAYAGLDSELAVHSETMSLTCIMDSNVDGLTEGEEIFQWDGNPQPPSPLHWQNEGSGTGPQVSTLKAQTSAYLQNYDFEEWTGGSPNAPTDWTVDSGGASISKATGGEVYRGSSTLKYTGTSDIKISQTLPEGALVGLKAYGLACAVKMDSGQSGTFTVRFEDSGGSSVGGTGIVISASYPTSFTLKTASINMPATIPAGTKIVVKFTGGTTAKSVWIDSLAFAPVSWHGGVNAFIAPGIQKFARGDRFSFDVSNNDAGLFQTFFRKYFRAQLPSAASGSETIADSLATD